MHDKVLKNNYNPMFRISVNKFGWKPPEPPELVRVVFKRFGEVRVVLGSGGFGEVKFCDF